MNSVRKFFLDKFSATRTHFRCVSGVNHSECPTGFFRFVGHKLDELPPRSISYAFCEKPAFHHFPYIKILTKNLSILIYKYPTELMREIFPFIRYSLVNFAHHFPVFSAFQGSFFAFRKSSLGFGKSFCFFLEKMGVFNLFAIGNSSERSQPKVNANRGVIFWKMVLFDLTRKASMPFSRRTSSYSKSFYGPPNRSMQYNVYISYLGKPKTSTYKFKSTVGVMRKSKAIVSSEPLESRMSGLLSFFNTVEKIIKRNIKSRQGILEKTRMSIFKPGVSLFPFRKKVECIVSGKMGFFGFPCVLACFKGFIINASANIKGVLKQPHLMLCGVKPVFKGFSYHVSIVEGFC